MKRIFIVLFSALHFLTTSSLTAEEPIVVRLANETKRLPLYLTHITSQDLNFAPAYCSQLEKILLFDLDHNGMNYIVSATAEKENLAQASSLDQIPRATEWKSLGALYVVKINIHQGKISARLFSANSETAKSINGFPLSGQLANDRKQIHQLADTIHKTLFDSDGVASTKLLYSIKTQQGTKWNSEIYESDYDGGNQRQLTFNSGYSITPIYIPPKAGFTAGGFFYISYLTGQPKIYYQGIAEGSSARRLTLLRGNQLMPALSKQRDKIAFISDVTGNPDLFVQPFTPEKGATEKPYQIFSTHLATQGSPTFSPDGKRIAFVSNKDGAPRIYVMDVPNSGASLKDIKATLVTKKNRESTAPCWSPDGNKIAYCASVQGTRQVWLYDFVTKEERQLTQGPGNKENPTWAPNSLHIAFNSSDRGASDLYLINLNQADAVKITSGSGEKRFPCWEPK